MATTRVTMHRAAVGELLSGPSGPVVREVLSITRRVENKAKSGAPVDTGKLSASIGSAILTPPGRVVGRVGTGLDYALYQHEGTGIHGPRGQVIKPQSARVLVFKAKGMGPLPATRSGRAGRRPRPLVYARYVRGTPPLPFLVDALRDASPYPVRTIGTIG